MVRDIVILLIAGAGDLEVIGAQLCVVEEEGSLLGCLLLKDDIGRLGLALLGGLDIGDLAAVEKSV